MSFGNNRDQLGVDIAVADTPDYLKQLVPVLATSFTLWSLLTRCNPVFDHASGRPFTTIGDDQDAAGIPLVGWTSLTTEERNALRRGCNLWGGEIKSDHTIHDCYLGIPSSLWLCFVS